MGGAGPGQGTTAGQGGLGPGPGGGGGGGPTGPGGMPPGPGPGGQMVAGATPPGPGQSAAQGGTTGGFGGGGGGPGQSLQDLFAAQAEAAFQQQQQALLQQQLDAIAASTTPVAAAPEPVPEEEEETRTTNSIIEAIFNKNLRFEYDPVKDYVNRVYGRLNPVAKKRLLQKVGYDPDMSLSEAVSDFEGFLNEYGQDLYDAGNLQFSDIANIFKPKPQVETEPVSGQQIAGQVIGKGLEALALPATLPFTNPLVSFMTGNIPGMFTSLALREGDFQLDEAGNIVGDIANLQNAPQNYIDAVIDQQGGLTNEQVAQISMGEQLAAEQQQASGGPFVPPSTSLAEEGAASAPDPQQPAPTDPAPVDLDAVYSGLSDAEKATVDKIVEMDDYDLPYALTYVLYGGPLF